MFKKFIAAAALAVGFASASSAATFTATYQGSDPFGTPNLSETVSITSPSYTGGAQAGLLRLTGDNGIGDFLAFCVDLTKSLSAGSTYTTSSSSAYSALVEGDIDRLFTSVYASIDTAIEAAAFQLALWEIISDNGATYDLSAGSFIASASGAVMQQAAAYLAGLANAATGGYQITYLHSRTSQDLVTVSPVPVPAALGMLGLGIAGLFGLKRRRSIG